MIRQSYLRLRAYSIRRFACPILLGLSLFGCASTSNEATSAHFSAHGEQPSCESLETLFSKSNNNFESIRMRPSYQNKITLWDTKLQLIPNSCEIWQWSDKYSYVCSKTYPDQQTAHDAYEQGQTLINQCLGSNQTQWYEKQNVLDGKGEETLYLFNNRVRGSLKKLKVQGLFKDTWSVYFWIDSPSLLE